MTYIRLADPVTLGAANTKGADIMEREIVVTLSTAECCAIAARAEVERIAGEPGVWSALWARIKPQIEE